MAIAAAGVWEVRPTNGSDTNGGGFVAGITGTDFSQQNAKNTTGNNISTTDAVATGSSTITSATAAFTSAIVGNIIYLSGGSGSLAAGWYQVTVFTNATTVQLDRVVAAGTGITMNIGGALQSLVQALTNFGTQGQKVFVKAESTLVQTATASSAASATNSATSPRGIIEGYTSTRGDNGMATIQLSTNSGLTAISLTNGTWGIYNFIIDCNNLPTSTGLSFGTGFASNVVVKNFTKIGVAIVFNAYLINCEVTGGSSEATSAVNATVSILASIISCYIHDNACPGIVLLNSGLTMMHSIIANNTGASSDGYQFTSNSNYLDNIVNNIFYGNGRNGIFYNVNVNSQKLIQNNIFANNGAYGINFNTTPGTPAAVIYDGNAFYSNTSGTRSNMDDTGAVNKQDGVAPYVNVNDITCSTTPFVNAASDDWRLNQTATGGGLIRGNGIPKTWLNLAGNRSFPDMGALEHQDPGFAS